MKLFGGKKSVFPVSVTSDRVIAVSIQKRAYPCWASQTITDEGVHFQGDRSITQPVLFFFFLFLVPIGFGSRSVFLQSHLSCRGWLLPALCSSGRGCPGLPLTPAPEPLRPPGSPRSAGWEHFSSQQPWGRPLRLTRKTETALRRKSFNTLIKGFRFIWAILNYRVLFFFFFLFKKKLHSPALQVPLVIPPGLTAFPYISFSHFGFHNEIIKRLMVC